MVRTLQRRTIAGGSIPNTLQLKVKLSPSGRALFATGNPGTGMYRKVWNGSQYIDASGADHAVTSYVVAWTADETYQVAIGSGSPGVTSIYLRSFNIATGANSVLSTGNNVLGNATAVLGIERIVGDYFIAYTQSRIIVFTINRTTNTLVVLSNTVSTISTIRGIAGDGQSNVIVVHSGPTNANNGFQSYSVDLSTGVLTPIGSQQVQGLGRISGFDFRSGKVLSYSRYNLNEVMFLQLNGSSALVPVPGFSALTLQTNMTAAAAQTTTAFMHLAFEETEITYLSSNDPGQFFSADIATLSQSGFAPPANLPTGRTNAIDYGEIGSRTYASYSENGKIMAFTFPFAAALTGVYVFSEVDDPEIALIPVAPMAEATLDLAINDSAQFIPIAPMGDATVDAATNENTAFLADAPMADAFVVLTKLVAVDFLAQAPMASAFVQFDNTQPAEIVAVAPMADAFIRDRGNKRRGVMVVQTL